MWHWPQMLMLSLNLMGCGFAIAKYGRAKPSDTFGLFEIMAPWGQLAILYCGGFFG